MLEACACMGVRPGDEYCYCQLKERGMSTAHYEWTEEEKRQLQEVLQEAFGMRRSQVPAMATSGSSGQNVGADRPSGLCDERLAGDSSPAGDAPIDIGDQ